MGSIQTARSNQSSVVGAESPVQSGLYKTNSGILTAESHAPTFVGVGHKARIAVAGAEAPAFSGVSGRIVNAMGSAPVLSEVSVRDGVLEVNTLDGGAIEKAFNFAGEMFDLLVGSTDKLNESISDNGSRVDTFLMNAESTLLGNLSDNSTRMDAYLGNAESTLLGNLSDNSERLDGYLANSQSTMLGNLSDNSERLDSILLSTSTEAAERTETETQRTISKVGGLLLVGGVLLVAVKIWGKG